MRKTKGKLDRMNRMFRIFLPFLKKGKKSHPRPFFPLKRNGLFADSSGIRKKIKIWIILLILSKKIDKCSMWLLRGLPQPTSSEAVS